jgi:hypothetical protein
MPGASFYIALHHTAMIADDLSGEHKTKAYAAIEGGEPKPANIPESKTLCD